jgi:hypothetical protein
LSTCYRNPSYELSKLVPKDNFPVMKVGEASSCSVSTFALPFFHGGQSAE